MTQPHASGSGNPTATAPYGLDQRLPCKPYLSMPGTAAGAMPPLLSLTGAFRDTARLDAEPGLIPYDLIISFWSDGAAKSRWMALPNSDSTGAPKIRFSPTGEWRFPKGAVFVKHFELTPDETRPEVRRRLETRLLVCDSTGGVYGVTYKWRPDNSDADLLQSNLTERILIRTATGVRTQAWYYPSREDCRTCHTLRAGGVLGPKTRQLNGPLSYKAGQPRRLSGLPPSTPGDPSPSITDNQLRTWNHIGLFEPPLDEEPADPETWSLPGYPSLAAGNDTTRSLEDRARSYLDANCAHCHRPGGTILDFDTRYDIPLDHQGLINGQALIDEGLDNARLIAPRDIWRSIVFFRVNTLEGMRMPPLAHNELDRAAVSLLREWIESMPGRPVLAPPSFSIRAGHFAQPIDVALAETEPGAEIHYTLDGSVPNKSDPLYKSPIHLASTTVLRARAFKSGFTKSITSHEVYAVGE